MNNNKVRSMLFYPITTRIITGGVPRLSKIEEYSNIETIITMRKLKNIDK